jgi:hypothetical protein
VSVAFGKLDMDSNQQRNIEQVIDDLCENLVWTWAYFRALKGLHLIAKSSPDTLNSYTQLTSCLYHGLFDVLFIKINNFIDASKRACGFPKLFRLLRKYLSDDTDLLKQVKFDENRLKNEVDIQTVKSWRNGISAHLTQSYRDPSFFSSNRLHLNDLEILLELIAELLEKYSFQLLGRFNDTKHPSAEIIDEINVLFLPRAEQPN